MNTSLLVIILTTLLISCKPTPTDPTRNGVEGKWLWVESTGGISGERLLPVAGTSLVFEFGLDGSFVEYRNAVVTRSTSYVLAKERSITRDAIVDAIRLLDSVSHPYIVLSVTNDTLVLDDNHADGYVATYTLAR